MKPEELAKHVDLHVGKDGAWLELKTSTGNHYLFQPIQQFGPISSGHSTVVEWCHEVQPLADLPPEPVKPAFPEGAMVPECDEASYGCRSAHYKRRRGWPAYCGFGIIIGATAALALPAGASIAAGYAMLAASVCLAIAMIWERRP